MGSLDPVSWMHRFRKALRPHILTARLHQVVTQPHHEHSAPTVGTRTLFLHRTTVALAPPLQTVVLGSHVAIVDQAALSAGLPCGQTARSFSTSTTNPSALYGPLWGSGRVGPSNSMAWISACAKVLSVT